MLHKEEFAGHHTVAGAEHQALGRIKQITAEALCMTRQCHHCQKAAVFHLVKETMFSVSRLIWILSWSTLWITFLLKTILFISITRITLSLKRTGCKSPIFEELNIFCTQQRKIFIIAFVEILSVFTIMISICTLQKQKAS